MAGADHFQHARAASQGPRTLARLDPARQRTRCLGLVVNNSRSLVRSERQRYPNLASRVLALCLRRLGADWEEHWGHPVLVVESIVDESQHCGT